MVEETKQDEQKEVEAKKEAPQEESKTEAKAEVEETKVEEVNEEKSASGGSAKGGKEEAKEEQDEEVEVPKKFKGLVEEIEKLNVLELSELVKVLEKKFGVSAAAPVMAVGAAPIGGDEAESEEEKSSFDIELKSTGDQKIQVIKAVRELTGKGLKESKDIVDGAPVVVKEGVAKEEAEEIKKKLEAAGAVVELK